MSLAQEEIIEIIRPHNIPTAVIQDIKILNYNSELRDKFFFSRNHL
jgi:hypothetical protein